VEESGSESYQKANFDINGLEFSDFAIKVFVTYQL
jgi:hypothetical protein